MRAWFDAHTNEARLEADGAEFAALAAAVRAGGDTLPCVPVAAVDAATVLPLPNVAVRTSADPASPVAVRVEGPGLVLDGGTEHLDLLARDFAQLARAEAGAALLAEWFPGHAYLAAGSVPVVFTRTGAPAPD